MPAMRWDLDRFLAAQDGRSLWGDPYEAALQQLQQGRKTGHWMWYVFPQIDGLGSSEAARHFAIASIDEACAYLAHPILGTRLLDCARTLLGTQDRTADEILGPIDTRKLCSSMTLFMRAEPAEPLFGQVLDRFFDGIPDQRTCDILDQEVRTRDRRDG